MTNKALKTQSNNWPTRKMWAVILSGMIVGGVQSLIKYLTPELAAEMFLQQLDVWIQTGVMFASGWFTRSEVGE